MTARADVQAFNIDAEMLPSENSTLDFMLTVENTGEDWDKAVDDDYSEISYGCLYMFQ